ncbi:RNA 2',3'-cyclic phosphodiesterase [Cognaticolwellia beringensis]|uniref:RNA 2',3'-cyclic phosphodiesterase n=1 Tax=Cognaticolwellia beringensis TaxID=1967665 RepID=A0A222G952_9GAMM|nr:RNA 2',3'-cyclic phosphodiesterase [Cognaticolwellia beringensis]ASP48331.1 RNA 2',3'-cyclic phosphodiesterase [Cognaticolwellia beringensis]
MNKRMFLALDISGADKAKIAQWREQYLSLPFRAIDKQNFHVTLAFLGLVNKDQQANLEKLISQQHNLIQQQLTPLVEETKTLSLLLSKVGYFKTAQVLHLMPTVCPDWLIYLNKTMVELSFKCDISIENKGYLPHLSLYRKAKHSLSNTNKTLEKTAFKQPLSITSFSLYHSYSSEIGVRYEPVKTWKINS